MNPDRILSSTLPWLPQLSLSLDAEGVPTVIASGELDLYTAQDLRRFITAVIGRHGPNVTVDCRGIAFCDAAGLGALVAAANNADAAGGALVVTNATSRLRTLLRITGLTRRLTSEVDTGLKEFEY